MDAQVQAAVAAAREAIASGDVDVAVRLTPAAVRSDIDVLEAATWKAADGDPSTLFSDRAQEADERVHRYCGVEEAGE